MIGDSGGTVGPDGCPAEETNCDRFHDRIKEFTLVDDSASAAGVRVSIVEMSMRWSAGLTWGGHGRAF